MRQERCKCATVCAQIAPSLSAPDNKRMYLDSIRGLQPDTPSTQDPGGPVPPPPLEAPAGRRNRKVRERSTGYLHVSGVLAFFHFSLRFFDKFDVTNPECIVHVNSPLELGAVGCRYSKMPVCCPGERCLRMRLSLLTDPWGVDTPSSSLAHC